MDAFEQIVAELLWAEGYWVRTSVKVVLTKAEKVEIGRPSSPRWELDVVGYRASDNQLLALECKSYLDSTGVKWAEVCEASKNTRYKLFREPVLRHVVLNRLCLQMVEAGSCAPGVTATLGLVAGKISAKDSEPLAASFQNAGWIFWGPDTLRDKLRAVSKGSYDNQASSVVAKLLLRI